MNRGATLVEASLWMALLFGAIFFGENVVFIEIKKREAASQSLRLPYSGRRSPFVPETR